ncbi:MAG: tetratricopeptide (TPR) repeat protein, partial [Flavobacteriales bacterium]
MEKFKSIGPFLLVFVVAFLQFSNTLDYPYVWDDALVIVEHPDVRNGVSGIPELFRKQNTDYIHDQIGYRPIPLTTFALEQEFFGMNASVGHFNNVLLFAILCMVLYHLLVLLFFQEMKWLALMIVLFYAVHPLHTEVIANIKSRDELLQFLFCSISLINYVLWFRRKNPIFLLLGLLSFGLGFLSKENAIAILGIVGFQLLFFETGIIKRKLMALIPLVLSGFSALALMAFTLTTTEGQGETAGWGIFFEDQILGNSFMASGSMLERMGNGAFLLNRYLFKYYVPTELVYYTGYNHIPLLDILSWQLLLGMSTLVGMIAFTGVLINRKPIIGFGLLFFLVTLSPFLQIAVLMPDTMADRYMFAPTFGLSIAMIYTLYIILKKVVGEKSKWLTILATILLMAPYSSLTFARNRAWKDSFTLFRTDMPKLENCARAHKFLASEYYLKFQNTGAKRYLDSTISHLEKCISISDKTYHAQIELGYNYRNWGNPERGIKILEEAVKRFPNSMDPHFYLGNLYMKKGEFALAKIQFKTCIQLTPNNVDAYFLLANSYLELAEYDSSLALSSAALSAWPNDNSFRDIRANTYLKINQPDSALNEVGQMLIRDQQNPDLWKKLIGYYNVLGMQKEAQFTYQDAVNRG